MNFISFSSKDEAIAGQLYQRLIEAVYDCRCEIPAFTLQLSQKLTIRIAAKVTTDEVVYGLAGIDQPFLHFADATVLGTKQRVLNRQAFELR